MHQFQIAGSRRRKYGIVFEIYEFLTKLEPN